MAMRLRDGVGGADAELEVHRFPDGEARVRIEGRVVGQPVVLVAALDHPDQKILPLLFTAAALRDLGAVSVGLVAPYLPYLRQDRAFRAGEVVSARYFAGLLGRAADWLLTVDPHLHRIGRLEDLFPIPVEAVHSAPAIAEWIQAHVARPLLIGPDRESAQWVEAIARRASAPWTVLTKRRRGDREMEMELPVLPGVGQWDPVLVDDIISTGATMRRAIRLLRQAGYPPPRCLAVHAVFADAAEEVICAGAREVITCNTLDHPSNRIDVLPLIAEGIERLLGRSYSGSDRPVRAAR